MAVQERAAEDCWSRYNAEICAAWVNGEDPSLRFTVAGSMEKLFGSTRSDDRWMAELIKSSRQAAEC